MLRALFVTAIILYGLWQSRKGPYHALLLYLWWAYFRPDHWLWWDFVTQLNLSMAVGVYVLLTTLFSGRALHLGNGAVLMPLIAGQAFLSTIFSEAFAYSFPYWQDFAKTTIIAFLMVTLVDDEKKLRLTFVVIALSLGLEATKQGWGQLVLNPGAQNSNTIAMIGDNNGVAVGMLMLLAILVALGRTTASFSKFEKHLYRFMAVGILYRSISTYLARRLPCCRRLRTALPVASQEEAARDHRDNARGSVDRSRSSRRVLGPHEYDPARGG